MSENILDLVKTAWGYPGEVYLGFLPATPDTVAALFEYDAGNGVEHFFTGDPHETTGIQVTARAVTAATAYAIAESAKTALQRKRTGTIEITQETPIIDNGRDQNNPSRQIYTINFLARRI